MNYELALWQAAKNYNTDEKKTNAIGRVYTVL